MNRRSFFKTMTGFAAGVYAAFVPSKGLSVSDVVRVREDLEKAEGLVHNKDVFVTPSGSPAGIEKRSGTRPATKEDITALGRGDCRYLEKRSNKKWHWMYMTCDKDTQAKFKCYEKE